LSQYSLLPSLISALSFDTLTRADFFIQHSVCFLSLVSSIAHIFGPDISPSYGHVLGLILRVCGA
jgi:hypothetical protein